jgi:hypothetical protein
MQPDAAHGAGPSNLAKAINDEEQPDAATVLTELRFRRGFQRVWSDDVQQFVVLLYEFCDAAGAQGYFDHRVQLATSPESIQERLELPELPDGAAFGGQNDSIRFVHTFSPEGSYFAQVTTLAVLTGAPPRDELGALGRDVLRVQLERLR